MTILNQTIPMQTKTYRFLSALLGICAVLSSGDLKAELLYSGRAQTLLYNYEDLLSTPSASSTDNYRFFQFLRLNLKNRGEKNTVSFHTYLRVTDDLKVNYSDDPNWRLYNGYLQWDTRLTGLTVGRQWLHLGPSSVTLDGVKMSVGGRGPNELTGYIGTESPFTRKFDSNGFSKAGSGGLYFTTREIRNLNLGIGFYQKSRDGETAFRELGVNSTARLSSGFRLYSRLDVNLLNSSVQKGQVRLRYKSSDRVQVFGEFKHYRPRLFYQSYYQKFELDGNNQLRGGVSLFVRPEVSMNASYSAVMLENDTNGFLTLGLSSPNGWVNYYKGHGFGGDQDGFAFGGSLPLAADRFEIFADIDYSRFRFYEEDDRDYLFSSIFGLHWRPSDQLDAGIEFEDVNNDVFSKDFRVLLKFAWNFSSAFLTWSNRLS